MSPSTSSTETSSTEPATAVEPEPAIDLAGEQRRAPVAAVRGIAERDPVDDLDHPDAHPEAIGETHDDNVTELDDDDGAPDA